MKLEVRWKRFNYLVHRWIGIVLGIQLLAWFISGIAMMYYPYPALTESRRLALLDGFEPGRDLVGFRTAYEAVVADFEKRGHPVMRDPERTIVGGRLMRWDGEPVYQLWYQHGARVEACAIVDARTGQVLTPLSAAKAARVGRAAVSALVKVDHVDLLPRGDNYMMYGSERLAEFPVYRVHFADDDATAAYVGRETGHIYEVVNRVTRVTTWIGLVPHYVYFMWVYQHPTLWTWINYILPAVGAVAALAGIILGVYQLFPYRRRGDWRSSGYQGVSKWHHVAGIVFGLMVLDWTVSGVFEMFGVSNDARVGQAVLARGGPVRWRDIRVSEDEAMRRLVARVDHPVLPLAIDLEQLDGRPGYHFRMKHGVDYWVDAVEGVPRGELEPEAAKSVAQRIVEHGQDVEAVDRITKYDRYYYAHHGREMHLPAWRVAFRDASESVVYLDTVSGQPVGFVDADTRLWRWLRNGMHSLDFPGLVNRRPYWDVVVLPLMVGGNICAMTGVWLVVRRLRRMMRKQ